ncbi:sterol desaturase family protein [Tenacibaculum ovolyticum]|uniref:sterol desaturase family protein n=1 Tax=Tenacibaculum ovolyticum TaxID=104270 RepID=UPI003BAD451F
MNLKEPFIFFTLLIAANIASYILNIIISKIWDNTFKHQTTTSKKEFFYSLLTLGINILIAIPGYLLWYKGIIIFSNNNFLVSFIAVFLLMDFLMYLLHWLSHTVSYLKNIHAKHHEHSVKFNVVSLYYMSPWESIFFGLLLTTITILFSFNLYSFIFFLIFNWFYGVITHLNVKKSRRFFLIFTTNAFHKEHHELNNKNYGFYTTLWDKVFKTETKEA